MKKRIVLVVACVLLLFAVCLLLSGVESSQLKSSQYWFGGKDHMTVSVHLMPDWDGLTPLHSAMFFWERYENVQLNPTSLDGGEYRQGTWSQKGDVLTLKFDDGEVMTGTFSEERLLLDYDGGFLLDFNYHVEQSE